MSPIRPFRPGAVGLALVALLAGCGDGAGSDAGGSSGPASGPPSATTPADNGVADLSANGILSKAKDALGQASSVHIKGGGFSEGQQFALDMRYGSAGATGSLTANGQTIELLRVGPTVYLKGTEVFWRSIGGASAAELLKGRYLEVPANTPNFSEIAGFTDLRKNAQELLTPDGTISKGERKTINGVKAIALNSSKGGTLYIALQGNPYPLQVVPSDSSKSDETGSLEFLDYGVPVAVTPPHADQVVDVSKLGVR
jgi:hypothetical protein